MLQLLLILFFSCLCNCQEIPKFPIYVGIGYDVVVGNPKTDRVDGGFRNGIFQLTYNDGKKTDDGKFLIPDKMVARSRSSCSFTASTQQFTGTNSYQQSLKTLVDISTSVNGWLADVSFSASTEFNSMRESTTESESMVLDSEARCEAYSLEMDSFNTPQLDDGFKNAIMIASKNPNDTSIWYDVIKTYGTHYVIRAYYGGRMHLQSRVQRKKVQELTAMGINVKIAAGLKYKVFSANIDAEVEANRKQLDAFENKIEETKEIYIGGKPPKTGKWMDWYDEVLVDPVPTSYEVSSLSRLISSINFPDLDNQIEVLKNSFDKSLKDYCNQRKCFLPGTDPAFPRNITVTVNKTPLLYNSKSGDRVDFEDPIPLKPLMGVKKVIINLVSLKIKGVESEYIAGMRFVLSDSIINEYTTMHGEASFPSKEWDIPDGEYITQIEAYWSSNFWNSLGGVQFFTNKGKSPVFGYTVGTSHLYNLKGTSLVGIRGYFTEYGFETFGFITTELVF